MTLIDWLQERLENTQRIAATKTGADREGWLEDGRYFAMALAQLAEKDRKIERLLQELIVAGEKCFGLQLRAEQASARTGGMKKEKEAAESEIERLKMENAELRADLGIPAFRGTARERQAREAAEIRVSDLEQYVLFLGEGLEALLQLAGMPPMDRIYADPVRLKYGKDLNAKLFPAKATEVKS